MSTSKGHSKRTSEKLGSKPMQRPLRYPQRIKGRERRHRIAALDHNYKEAETEDDQDTEDDDEDDDNGEEDNKDDSSCENDDDNNDGNSVCIYTGDSSSQEDHISDDLLQDDDYDDDSSSSEDDDSEDDAYESCDGAGKRKRTSSRSPVKYRKSERLRIPVIDLSRTSKVNETTSQIMSSSSASSNSSRTGCRVGDCHHSTESSYNRDVSDDTCQSSMSGDYSYLSICSPDDLTSLSALSQSGFRRFFPEVDSNGKNEDRKKHEDGSQEMFSVDRIKGSRKKHQEEYLSASKVSGCKPVVQMDLNNNVLHRYASQTIAANLMGICRKKISLCCDGRLESIGSFRWRLYKGAINAGNICNNFCSFDFDFTICSSNCLFIEYGSMK
jgi:hypothetical protein